PRVLRLGPLLRRGQAGDVLGGQHEHLAADVVMDLVRERPALLAQGAEPDLDRVARLGAGDLAAHPVVVAVVALAVPLAAPPLLGRLDARAAVVDLVVQEDRAELALGVDLDRLVLALTRSPA